MTQRTNEYGQPIGAAVADWQGALPPPRTPMQGRFCRIEPLDAEAHLDDLHQAFEEPPGAALWTYMATGPFPSREAFGEWLTAASRSEDPLFFALKDRASGKAVGLASYLRIAPQAGSIEVGSIVFSQALKRTATATEAMYLMMQRAFEELGYRRYEWKCDALNEPSRRAAERLGFRYEGLFRQALVYKGRNRDTAWYAMLDTEWPAVARGFENWFDPANFDPEGRQKQSLATFMTAQRNNA